MSRAVSPSGAKPYGLARVCRVWRVARSTVHRHRAPAREVPPRLTLNRLSGPAIVRVFGQAC
jgi:hypothetical protein